MKVAKGEYILASESMQYKLLSFSTAYMPPLIFKSDEDGNRSLRYHTSLSHGFTNGANMALTGAALDDQVHGDGKDMLQPFGNRKNLLFTSEEKD